MMCFVWTFLPLLLWVLVCRVGPIGSALLIGARHPYRGPKEATGLRSIAGAANVGKTDYSPLSNRDVLVWPDDDPAGREAGEVVAHQLAGVGVARVRLATTHQKNDGGDAADLAPDTRLARLRELLESTPDYRCSSDFSPCRQLCADVR